MGMGVAVANAQYDALPIKPVSKQEVRGVHLLYGLVPDCRSTGKGRGLPQQVVYQEAEMLVDPEEDKGDEGDDVGSKQG